LPRTIRFPSEKREKKEKGFVRKYKNLESNNIAIRKKRGR